MTEQAIQRKIKKDLEAKGAYVTKVNPGVYGAPVGHADLIVSIPVNIPSANWFMIPICLYVEVKTRTGKLSMMQGLWHKRMAEECHFTCVAMCTEDVLMYLESQGIAI